MAQTWRLYVSTLCCCFCNLKVFLRTPSFFLVLFCFFKDHIHVSVSNSNVYALNVFLFTFLLMLCFFYGSDTFFICSFKLPNLLYLHVPSLYCHFFWLQCVKLHGQSQPLVHSFFGVDKKWLCKNWVMGLCCLHYLLLSLFMTLLIQGSV